MYAYQLETVSVVDQDVARFEVSVADELAMHEFKCGDDLCCVEADQVSRQSLKVLDQILQGAVGAVI